MKVSLPAFFGTYDRPTDQPTDGQEKTYLIPKWWLNIACNIYFQNLCPPEEFDSMIEALQRDLPASFRVTGGR